MVDITSAIIPDALAQILRHVGQAREHRVDAELHEVLARTAAIAQRAESDVQLVSVGLVMTQV